MIIKEYDKPSPHIIIDDFFSDEELKNIKKEIHNLIPKMYVGKFSYDKEINVERKNNLNIWLDKEYRCRRNESSILNSLSKNIWSDEVKNFLNETNNGIFRMYKLTNIDHTLLSAYKNGSFYGEHEDSYDGLFLTSNIMIGDGFTGGDFILKGKTIPFKDNRLIIFESHINHSVTEVITDNNKDNWRYSIQYFAKFN